jgi:hypothetical protein
VGWAWLASGDAHQAVTLLAQAANIADTTGDVEPAAKSRSGLARTYLRLGDPAAALAAAATARAAEAIRSAGCRRPAACLDSGLRCRAQRGPHDRGGVACGWECWVATG